MKFFNKLIVSFLVCALAMLSAQAQTIPEIINDYNKATDVNLKISLLVKLGLNYQNIRAYRKAIDYYEEGLKLQEQNNIAFENTFMLKNIATCYEELHDYKSALSYWKIILSDKKNKGEIREVIISLEKLINVSVLNNDFSGAINYSLALLPEYSTIDNKYGIVSIYNNLTSFYKKIGNSAKSQEYFIKCQTIIDAENSGINQSELADILLSIGITHTVSGEIAEANHYLDRSLKIRIAQKKNVEVANILNYMAATDLIGEFIVAAKVKVERALAILEQAKDEPGADEIKIASYRIYCELLLRKRDIKNFKIYNDLYNKAKDHLIGEEQRQNLIVLEQQVEIEKKESEIRKIQAEKEIKESSFRQTQLEKEKIDRENIIQAKEIEFLRQSRDLQLTRIKNQELDKQRIAQLLEIAHQKASGFEQQRAIAELEQNKRLQLLTIEKQSKENKLLDLEKRASEQKLADEAIIRRYTIGLILLLLFVAIGIFGFLRKQKKSNAILAQQNEIIHKNNEQIVKQNNEYAQVNEELSQVNEELYAHRESLEKQNTELETAKHTIADQNEELTKYNIDLEDIVNKRTEELISINNRLTKNNRQLEQFGFVVSHNLRGPIARLLGLASIVNKNTLDGENKMFIDKMVEVSMDLDLIIHDLNKVLEIQKGIEQELVFMSFDQVVKSILLRLENKIEETGAHISLDFSNAPKIKVIKPYFESILYNLVSNAIKYSKPDKTPEIKLVTEDIGDYVVLKISDEGIGIDLERHREKLFGLYKRFHTHVEGKGLGLYMVKTQLEAMEGKIELVSAPNKGSVFSVYFKKDFR